MSLGFGACRSDAACGGAPQNLVDGSRSLPTPRLQSPFQLPLLRAPLTFWVLAGRNPWRVLAAAAARPAKPAVQQACWILRVDAVAYQEPATVADVTGTRQHRFTIDSGTCTSPVPAAVVLDVKGSTHSTCWALLHLFKCLGLMGKGASSSESSFPALFSTTLFALFNGNGLSSSELSE